MKHSVLAIVLSLFAASQALALSLIELVDGGSIEGEVIAEKSDRVFVDIGFDVITVPQDSVLRIVEEEEAVKETSYNEALFRETDGGKTYTVKELVERHGEAVVTVRTPMGMGSGFVIHPDGYVVTNDHVIAGEHQVTVTIFERDPDQPGGINKIQFENVRIVATSPEWDLALLKVEDASDRKFQTVALGESYALRQGQRVFAIGNPLGLERSVSEGIVSIQNRPIDGRLFIQTTTQINPGNSGGPLFNLRGEVIGVNNMKVVAFGAEGLGFAIPSAVLKSFLRNRDAFAFDPRNPNSGYRYNAPPLPVADPSTEPQE